MIPLKKKKEIRNKQFEIIEKHLQLKSKLEKGKLTLKLGFPGGSVVKNPLADGGHMGFIPGLGRCPGGGHGNPLQYFCLENPTDREAWSATVHGVPKSHTQLRGQTTTSKLKLYLDNSSYLECSITCKGKILGTT